MSPLTRRPPGIELALLCFFQDGPLHGYQIHQMISQPEGLGTTWHIKQSQLYALLSKLEKDGYLSGSIEFQETAHPPRKMYRLTDSGVGACKEWLENPVTAPRLLRQEFMVKLFFVRQIGNDPVRALIDRQKMKCSEWQDKLRKDQDGQSPFNQMVCLYRIGQIEAALVWLEQIRP